MITKEKAMKTCAEILKKARKQSGMSQSNFIKHYKLNIKQGTYSRWENGTYKIPAYVLLRIGAIQPVDLSDGGEK
ncbi:helix-turn-helix transcriptional regulator [Photobacterium rosenbergii]|uniref:Helix-turn-helix transcriptional regulator n=1 Tax=Photobacterium rosenbergii TaxID=294936 RepID=A0ABU3ZBL2_9GAMM|nr:helix-turn-helix transcriptional regulator [Photobacterium rosenbergii]MDV5167497.1 helix-turn-helix transcriptional regulator [Photobacterium rosenbergii]